MMKFDMTALKDRLSAIKTLGENTFAEHSTEIVAGMAISGLVCVIATTIRATRKSDKIVEEKEEEKGEPLTVKEKVVATWPCWIPVAASAALTGGCILYNAKDAKDAKAELVGLSAACHFNESVLRDRKEAEAELLPKNKLEEINAKVAQKMVDKDPYNEPAPADGTATTASGAEVPIRRSTLIKDGLTGPYFRDDVDHIRWVVIQMNEYMKRNDCVNLSYLLEEVHAEPNWSSDHLFWNYNDGAGTFEVDFSPSMAPNGEPCLVMTFTKDPVLLN